jgi:uncharacterized SAM-binding protein YcdF (DUF218 family)
MDTANLTSEEITSITSYLDATTPLPQQADLIFVFGSRQLTPAQLAIELYSQQIAPLIVLTGGANRSTGINEANTRLAILIEAGIPEDEIIVENRSTNTYENVTFALPLIEQKVALSSIHSMLVVCKWMHSRRALMTLKRQLPRDIRYYAQTYAPENVTRENWHLNPRAEGANVLKNWEAIPRYLEWGHLEEITRNDDCYI